MSKRRGGLPHDIWMLQLFQQRYLTYCSAWNAFILCIQSNFLQCQQLPALAVFGFVHNTISALSNLLQFVVAIHRVDVHCFSFCIVFVVCFFVVCCLFLCFYACNKKSTGGGAYTKKPVLCTHKSIRM